MFIKKKTYNQLVFEKRQAEGQRSIYAQANAEKQKRIDDLEATIRRCENALNQKDLAIKVKEREKYDVELELAKYKDALGDISEAIKHVSPNISLNAIKQIKDVLARFEEK